MQSVVLSKKHKALVLPQKLVPGPLLPLAKTTTLRGQEVALLPHTMDAVRLLANLGVDAPAPIKSYYDWPIHKYPSPMAHQVETAAFMAMTPYSFVLNDIGTSKTLTALWAADYLLKEKAVRKVLVIAPLSTLDAAWADELFFNLPHRRFAVLYGSAARRRKLLASDADIYIINHDGFQILYDDIVARGDIDQVILDESAVYRNARTDKYRALRAFLNHKKARPEFFCAMTGTPTPRLPTDAWAQTRLVAPKNVPQYFGQFRSLVMEQILSHKWVPKAGWQETVSRVMQPAIRYTRDECIDLPPTVYQYRKVELTPKQKKLYNEMAKKMQVLIETDPVAAANSGVLAMKLIQICAGALYGPEKRYRVDVSNRLNALQEILDETAHKVIVFAPLTEVVDLLHERLRNKVSTAVVDGRVSPTERKKIFRNFQQNEAPRLLVAHPKTMAHGLTLTEAATIVWWAPYRDPDLYVQANGRITRPGQKHIANIIHLYATYLEKRAFNNLQEAKSQQDLLLDMVKQRRLLE